MKTQHDYWQEDHDRTIEEMKSDPLYGAIPPNPEPNGISLMAGSEEMLRCSKEGFWVRGIRVEQDDTEAATVYNAFKAWMSWAQLNRDYK